MSPLDVMRLESVYTEHDERVRAAVREYWIAQNLAPAAVSTAPGWLAALRQRWQSPFARRAPVEGPLPDGC